MSNITTVSFDLQEIISQLKPVLPTIDSCVTGMKKVGTELKGPCPKCGGDDRFYIRPDNSFGCRQCNDRGGDVIEFHKWMYGATITDLSKQYLNGTIKKMKKARAIPANLTARYIYRDVHGNEVFQVHRFEERGCEKTFQQWYIDPKTGNRMGPTKAGVKPVPYNLPGISTNEDIYLVEGEKDADRLISEGVPATTTPGGALNFKPQYASWFKNKNVFLIPDQDGPGTKYRDAVLKSCLGVAASVKVVNLPRGKDVSEFLDMGGTMGHIRSLILNQQPEAPGKDSPKPAFQLVKLSDIKFRPPEFLIDGLMEVDTMVSIFSDPGSGKTFLAIDAACCVATGKDFHGRFVKQGPVVFIAGEGQNGLKRRFTAWGIRHQVDLDTAPIFLSMMPTGLCDMKQVEHVNQAIQAISDEYGKPALVVVDTVARNFGPGDENSTKDMSAFVSGADKVRGQFKCCMLLIHHSGHGDKSRGRGAMALRGALDVDYRMEKDDNNIVRFSYAKPPKDFEIPQPMAFKLNTVELPYTDAHGRNVTSAILDDTDYVPPEPQGSAGKGKWQMVADNALSKLYWEHRDKLEARGYDGSQARVSINDWRDACYNDGMNRQAWYRVKKELQDNPEIHFDGIYVTPCNV